MRKYFSILRINPLSRRSLLRGGAAAMVVAALSSCDSTRSLTSARAPTPVRSPTDAGSPAVGGANARVGDDGYGVHVEPSVAANPLNPLQLLVACQVSPTADPQFIASYLSTDGGASWQNGGIPRLPTGATKTGDDVTYFQPNLAVDQTGRVAISAFALANGRVSHVLLVSQPRKLRFGPPLQVTTTAFDPHSSTTGGKHGAWWIGDYQGITANAGAFQLVWNDTRAGKLNLFAATVHP